jgi:hypothetical protein
MTARLAEAELLARRDAKFREHLAETPLYRPRTQEHPDADPRVGQAIAASSERRPGYEGLPANTVRTPFGSIR